MARYCGKVGYVSDVETSPGVYEEEVYERTYYGDIIKHSSRWDERGINNNILVNNEISILADPYAYQHFSEMRYIEYMGSKWKIANLTVSRPRITITMGGLYNENSSGFTEDF